MKHLLTIIEIEHVAKNGKVLWQANNLQNTLHTSGEEFALKALFTNGKVSTIIPTNYYFGLDNRTTINVDDTMTTIADTGGEPSTNSYFRQAVASLNQFTISLTIEGINIARSPIVSFVASGGSWGPVTNLFLTDQTDNSGYLIASVSLTSALTVEDGEGIHMRMGLSLKDCP